MANVLCRRLCSRWVCPARVTYYSTTYSCNNILISKYLVSTEANLSTNRTLLLTISYNCQRLSYYSDIRKDNKKCDSKEADVKPPKLTLFQKFKQMYRDYWYVLLPVHLVTSTVWFGGFYYMAKSGIDIAAILESWNVNDKLINPFRDSSMGYVAVAYALYKIATPARYTVTLGGTTISINYLKKWGYIKPVPSKERMREIYEQKKSTLAKSMKETREGIIDKKGNIIESINETKEGIKEKKDILLKSVSKTTNTIKKKRHEIKKKINIKDVKET